MRIPASFQVRYDDQRALVDEVRKRAEPRLRGLCRERHWLFDDRMKGPESVLAKLQLGRLHSIAEMDDFYAAVVVVPTQAEVEPAVAAVGGAFHTARREQHKPAGPQEFIYDDVHLVLTLGPLGPLDPSGLIGSRSVEVQIRTGYQWEWWRATHDPVYKGLSDWRVQRVAAEERASLDRGDRVLADLDLAAQGVAPPGKTQEETDAERVASWQERWPENRRPRDPRRFAETVTTFLVAAGLDLDQGEALLDSDDGKDVIENKELTPADVVLALALSVADVKMLGKIRAAGRWVLVTDELAAASLPLAALGPADRVAL